MEPGRLYRRISRLNLSSDDNRVCVFRPRGERLNPPFALQRQHSHSWCDEIHSLESSTPHPFILTRIYDVELFRLVKANTSTNERTSQTIASDRLLRIPEVHGSHLDLTNYTEISSAGVNKWWIIYKQKY
ncbi:hypothetical protein TNCV_3250201 [Trichonephila clavipes]|nr:hypothetical protein TNCV_3250201 [Trichonephila clavipes]